MVRQALNMYFSIPIYSFLVLFCIREATTVCNIALHNANTITKYLAIFLNFIGVVLCLQIFFVEYMQQVFDRIRVAIEVLEHREIYTHFNFMFLVLAIHVVFSGFYFQNTSRQTPSKNSWQYFYVAVVVVTGMLNVFFSIYFSIPGKFTQNIEHKRWFFGVTQGILLLITPVDFLLKNKN